MLCRNLFKHVEMLANLRKNIETIAKIKLLYVTMKRQNHNILGL